MKRSVLNHGPSECAYSQRHGAFVTAPRCHVDIRTRAHPARRFLYLFALFSVVSYAVAQHEQSMDAFVPAAHKSVFETYNLMVLGDLNIAKSSVEGRVAVSGKADVTEFDFNKGAAHCDKYKPALVVQGALHASMGAINNGYTITGSRSKVSHNVQMECSSRVERYNPVAQKIRTFEEHRESLIRETGDVCTNQPSGEIILDEESKVMHLTPGNATFSCYAVFKTSISDVSKVTRLEYRGTDVKRNVIINVSGKFGAWRDLAMVGFNPERTLITFCGVQGQLQLFNNRIHGSIFAPSTEITAMGSIVNGSMITANMRGKLAILYKPYRTC